MKVGDLVKYKHDESYVGVIIEIGSNMFRIDWGKNKIEWLPEYALEVINESQQNT